MGKPSRIGVLDKSVCILRTVAEEPCSLGDLCERTGLPRATAHRLAVGLEDHRLLVRGADGLFHPGPLLAELAAGVADPLLDIAQQVLPRLRDSTQESVQIYRHQGDERVCIAAAEPQDGLRDTVPVGRRLPMTAGSGAKVLLAWADTSTRARYLSDAVFDESELAEVRARGWAQSTAERVDGVAGVAAPIRDDNNTVIAALCVSGPKERIERMRAADWAEHLIAATRAIERRLP